MSNLIRAIELAKTEAKNLLKQEAVVTFPVKLNKLAQSLGIEIKEMTFNENISGLLKRKSKNGTPVIVVNENDREQRKRFTIAHEIGHFILHSNASLHVDPEMVHFRDENSSRAVSIEEIQANQFAAELLMPTENLTKDLQKLYVPSKDNVSEIIDDLAEKYNVSSMAMTIRVGNLLKF